MIISAATNTYPLNFSEVSMMEASNFVALNICHFNKQTKPICGFVVTFVATGGRTGSFQTILATKIKKSIALLD